MAWLVQMSTIHLRSRAFCKNIKTPPSHPTSFVVAKLSKYFDQFSKIFQMFYFFTSCKTEHFPKTSKHHHPTPHRLSSQHFQSILTNIYFNLDANGDFQNTTIPSPHIVCHHNTFIYPKYFNQYCNIFQICWFFNSCNYAIRVFWADL